MNKLIPKFIEEYLIIMREEYGSELSYDQAFPRVMSIINLIMYDTP